MMPVERYCLDDSEWFAGILTLAALPDPEAGRGCSESVECCRLPRAQLLNADMVCHGEGTRLKGAGVLSILWVLLLPEETGFPAL